MTAEPPRPFDLDNTNDPSEPEMDALNGEFARLWPDWRIRGPKEVPDGEIARNLVHIVMPRYFGNGRAILPDNSKFIRLKEA